MQKTFKLLTPEEFSESFQPYVLTWINLLTSYYLTQDMLQEYAFSCHLDKQQGPPLWKVIDDSLHEKNKALLGLHSPSYNQLGNPVGYEASSKDQEGSSPSFQIGFGKM